MRMLRRNAGQRHVLYTLRQGEVILECNRAWRGDGFHRKAIADLIKRGEIVLAGDRYVLTKQGRECWVEFLSPQEA
jgi:hypothetical protein